MQFSTMTCGALDNSTPHVPIDLQEMVEEILIIAHYDTKCQCPLVRRSLYQGVVLGMSFGHACGTFVFMLDLGWLYLLIIFVFCRWYCDWFPQLNYSENTCSVILMICVVFVTDLSSSGMFCVSVWLKVPCCTCNRSHIVSNIHYNLKLRWFN